MGDQHVAAAYTHIYAFLKSRQHNDVAKALKKAAKGVVILKDSEDDTTPKLDEILKEWKSYREKVENKSTSDESDSSSESDSSCMCAVNNVSFPMFRMLPCYTCSYPYSLFRF
ncbi:hypothetical protein F5880DRAFT_1534344 [Lentinula raphanica]|nr:hypothetical protein F5880DRAFT_1534344 [Lentinula raphanica]